jgi:hypothetical protein
MALAATRQFLRGKILQLAARMRRLARIDPESIGLRAQDAPFAPSSGHLGAANHRLAAIDAHARARFAELMRRWQGGNTREFAAVQQDCALVERELDRARRAFGLFFEIFAQRGTRFAPVLAAYDVVAADCYAAVRENAPRAFRGRMLKPLCYMEHGYSPATVRRGMVLHRLLGEPNPFPVVRIPWDRDNPWQAVFLHELAHNLQADLGIWQENRQAVLRRLLQGMRDPMVASVYGRWHKEIFADLAALLLGGPAAAWGMATFLAHPAPRTMTFRPGGSHPTGYLRVPILAEMLRRMGFGAEANRLLSVWQTLYDSRRFHRMPPRLLATAARAIPAVVDETAYQTRRNLAQRALADVIRFEPEHERAIRGAARALADNRALPAALPPRFYVSAAQYALSSNRVPPRVLADRVVRMLNQCGSARAPGPLPTGAPLQRVDSFALAV